MADKLKWSDKSLRWMDGAANSEKVIVDLVVGIGAELATRDKTIRELNEKLAAKTTTISELMTQLEHSNNTQQPQPSFPSIPPSSPANLSTDLPQLEAEHTSLLAKMETLRAQLAAASEVVSTSCQQQQAASVAAEVAATPLHREVEELRRLAAEAAPLKQRLAEAESAVEAVRLQAAAAEQQLRRQVEVSRGRVAALESRAEAADKAAAEASSNYKTLKYDHDILTFKYGKLIGEKIVLQGLYDLLVFGPSPLSLEYVVRAVCWAHDALLDLAKEAARLHKRQRQYRLEAKKRAYGFE